MLLPLGETSRRSETSPEQGVTCLSGGVTDFNRGLIPLDVPVDLFGVTRGEFQRRTNLTRMQIGFFRQQIDTVLFAPMQFA